MTEDDLTPEQSRQLADSLGRTHRYIVRLRQRMEKRNFPADDKLLTLTREAAWALEALSMHVHYLQFPGKGRHATMPEVSCEHTPISSPQPHDQPQPNGNERRGD